MNHQKHIAQKKLEYCDKLHGLFRKYNRILVVTSLNVTATQMLHIRNDIQGKGEIIFGKNSLMRRAVDQMKEEIPSIVELEKHLYNGAGLIFTNDSFMRIKEIIDNNCQGSAAKVGAIAPEDVFLQPQRTSISPSDIKKFHALNIQCKIFKGTIEITGEKQLIKKGTKVGASEADILGLLGILPFKYTLNVEALYDNGRMYDPAILDITDETLIEKVTKALNRVSGLALGVGYPCIASAPHLIGSAFNNIAAIAVSIEHNMKQIENIQKILSDPEALALIQNSNQEQKEVPIQQEENHEDEDAAALPFDDLQSLFDF